MEQTLAQLNNIKNSEQIKKEEIYRLCEKLDRQLVEVVNIIRSI